MDLLKRLADKTHSMVLAGMVFSERVGGLVNLARWLIPDYQNAGRQWIVRDQGKAFPTEFELELRVLPERPCQHFIVVDGFDEEPFTLSAAICYDATDLKLASD